MLNILLFSFSFSIWFCFTPDFPPPPGTLQINHNLFMDKQQITFLDYYEFIDYINRNEPEDMHGLIPDDTTITLAGKTMWRNRKFDDFPIAGLDIHQMEAYCRWRSDRVNQLIENEILRCAEDAIWRQIDAINAQTKYRVVYSIPSAEDMTAAGSKVKKPMWNELLSNGMLTGSRHKNKLNNPNLMGFRCKAKYIQVN